MLPSRGSVLKVILSDWAEQRWCSRRHHTEVLDCSTQQELMEDGGSDRVPQKNKKKTLQYPAGLLTEICVFL